MGDPVMGIVTGKLILLCSRESHLSGLAMLASCCNFLCTSKGYVERETSLALLERERVIFQGSSCSPLKSAGFLWQFWVHQKGVWRKGNFSPFAQKRLSNFSGLALLTSQKCWFSVALLGAPVRGM